MPSAPLLTGEQLFQSLHVIQLKLVLPCSCGGRPCSQRRRPGGFAATCSAHAHGGGPLAASAGATPDRQRWWVGQLVCQAPIWSSSITCISPHLVVMKGVLCHSREQCRLFCGTSHGCSVILCKLLSVPLEMPRDRTDLSGNNMIILQVSRASEAEHRFPDPMPSLQR